MNLERPFIDAKYYETYYFANIIRNILHEPLDYVRNLDDFFGDERWLNFVGRFPKYSAFHYFIEFIVESVLFEDLKRVDFDAIRAANDRRRLPVNRALDYYEIPHSSFVDWLSESDTSFDDATTDDAYEYFLALCDDGPVGYLLDRIVAEVFFVMFPNRRVMQQFNQMIAGEVASSTVDEIPDELRDQFRRDGVLDRCHIPSWVQKAVFFRDRGQCVLCKTDISGLVNVSAIKNFDHIVPLSLGGLNDVTNIQLLCASCNNDKRDRNSVTSDVYETWF